MSKNSRQGFSEAVKGKILDEVWNNKSICIILIIATFVSGINIIFWYDVDLFIQLDLIKLIILATCIPFPILLLCVLLTFVLEWYIRDKDIERMKGKTIAIVTAIYTIIFTLQIIMLKMIINDFSIESAIKTNIVSYVIVFIATTLHENKKYRTRMESNS